MSTAIRSLVRVQSTTLGLPRALRPASSILLRRPAFSQPAPPVFGCRFHGSDAVTSQQLRGLTDRESSAGSDTGSIAARKALEPSYEMTFTCKQCDNRSSHRITKQAYHHGTVLVKCPGCKNQHLISDHMKVRRFAVARSHGHALTCADLLGQEHYHRGHYERKRTVHSKRLVGSRWRYRVLR